MVQKIHARFRGRTYAWDAEQVWPVGEEFGDEQLKRVVAGLLDVASSELEAYVVDRPETGHLIVRPQAVYG